jgi:hypothetical protein
MNRRTRLRRTGILCMHFLRNAAYYLAFNAAPVPRRREQFWRTVNGNFIDICLLEWCKLFGDLNAMHHWSKSVTDANAFCTRPYRELGVDEPQFEAYRIEVRTYRDKFVAHLDELNDIQIPRLRLAIGSVEFLYEYLVDEEDDVDAFADAPRSPRTRYQEHLREGRAAHRYQGAA